jgi:outer membrane immunogenic protein
MSEVRLANTWLVTAVLVGFSAPISLPKIAVAADIPQPVSKAPAFVPAPPPVTNWTGFYVNGGGGYGFWAADSTTTALGTINNEPSDAILGKRIQGGKGWVARVGGGYDHQFGPRIVAGAFADFDFSSLKGSVSDTVISLSTDIKQKTSWAVGARGGFLVTPNILTYTNVGFSSARFSFGNMVAINTFGDTPVGVPTGYVTPAFTNNGWFLGGGTEVSVGNGIFWRTEYRSAYYGNKKIQDLNEFATNATPRFNDINFKPTVQTFTTQLVYKFGSDKAAAIDAIAATSKTVVNWTGVYADAGLGYGLFAADQTSTPAGGPPFNTIVSQRTAGKGWLGRVGGGFDYQFGTSMVAGVFADYDILSLKGSMEDLGWPLVGDIKQSSAWAAGGRLGFLVQPELLAYLDGGFTSTHFAAASLNVPPIGPESPGSTPAFSSSGWFAGGGMEYSLTSVLGYQLPTKGLFVRNEYRYAQYETKTVADTASLGFAYPNINFRPSVQTVTSSLVYKFN